VLGRTITLLAAIATASLAVAHTPTPERAREVTPVVFAQPRTYGLGGNDAGPVSPAGCDIKSIEYPHVSTYRQVMHQIRAVKGNVRAECRHPVDELTLSVSIFDADTHALLIKGRPTKNQKEAALTSNDTEVRCINNNTTNYQVAALGTSYEQGHEYVEFKFSAIAPADCGHA
jgi:hypothetical protein